MTQIAMFDTPAARAPVPKEVYGAAHITDQYRWWLKRWWRAGPMVCWIMLNPSTADAQRNDPTMREVIRFTAQWGFAGCVVVNLYPFMSASPKACQTWADWLADGRGPDYYVRDALHHNVDVVAEHAKAADLVIAAWGAGAWDDMWVDHIVEEVQTGEAPWPDLYCLGKTAGRDPKHPLARGAHRIPRDQQPILWRPA